MVLKRGFNSDNVNNHTFNSQNMKKLLESPFKNIRIKTSIFVLLLLIATTLISYAVTAQIMRDHIMNEVIKRADSLSRSIASTAGYSSFSQDILGLDTLVFKVKSSNQDVESIAIVNPKSEVLVHSDVHQIGQTYHFSEGSVLKTSTDGTIVKEVLAEYGGFYEVVSPIVFMEKSLGSVVIHIDKSVLSRARADALRRIAWVFAAVLLMGIVASILLTSSLTRPIKELSVGVEELKLGKRGRMLKVYSKDELGKLTESFNEMTSLITNQQQELSKYSSELEESYISTVKVLAAAIDARDHYTLGHSERVADTSIRIGEAIGLSKEEIEELEVACLFHDVGKIKIPDSILLKEGNLNSMEYAEMKRHTEYGADILGKATSLRKYIPMVRYHHEWHDGTGYPDGLRGDSIPLSAAIIAIADVFDALTSERPYRKALTEEEALQTIQSLSGKQFHPELTETFIKLIKGKSSQGMSFRRN